MKELPNFQPRDPDTARKFAARVLNTGTQDRDTSLHDLIAYDDGHFRAIFEMTYFTLHEGATEPTRSQWRTLKKKFKRHDPLVFIFKQYGKLTAEDTEYYYLDFGFLKKS